MTITLDIPDVSEFPVWAWVTLGVAAWYILAGVVVRLNPGDHIGDPWDPPPIFWWLLSPFVLPVLIFWSVGLIVNRMLTSRPRND